MADFIEIFLDIFGDFFEVVLKHWRITLTAVGIVLLRLWRFS